MVDALVAVAVAVVVEKAVTERRQTSPDAGMDNSAVVAAAAVEGAGVNQDS